jgi:hypothetical protein
VKFRTGGKLDRTLYLQLGDEPDHRRPDEGGDLLIGLLDPGWGPVVAEAMNEHTLAYSGSVGILPFVDPKVADAVYEACERRRGEEAADAD